MYREKVPMGGCEFPPRLGDVVRNERATGWRGPALQELRAWVSAESSWVSRAGTLGGPACLLLPGGGDKMLEAERGLGRAMLQKQRSTARADKPATESQSPAASFVDRRVCFPFQNLGSSLLEQWRTKAVFY